MSKVKTKKSAVKVSTSAKRLLTDNPPSIKAVNKGSNKAKPSGRTKLTVKQQAFVNKYTDPSQPTFGNGTQSALQVYQVSTPNSAGVAAHALIRNPNVNSEIDRILNTIGLGNEVRQQERASIIRSTLLGKTITKRVKDTKTGEVYTEVTRGPAYSTKLKALDQMDKIAGVYNQAELQKELIRPAVQELAKTHLKEIKARIRARRETGEGGQGTYSGGDVSLS